MLRVLACLLALSCVAHSHFLGVGRGPCVDPEPFENFELSRLEGVWYEIIRTGFMEDPVCPTLEFSNMNETVMSDYTTRYHEKTKNKLSWLWGSSEEEVEIRVERERARVMSDPDTLSKLTFRTMMDGDMMSGESHMMSGESHMMMSDESSDSMSGEGRMREEVVHVLDTNYEGYVVMSYCQELDFWAPFHKNSIYVYTRAPAIAPEAAQLIKDEIMANDYDLGRMLRDVDQSCFTDGSMADSYDD